MKKNKNLTVGTVLALLLLLAAPGLYAENSESNSTEFYSYILVLGMTQEPDPISTAYWEQLRRESEALNNGTALRQDGIPYVAFDATPMGPAMVWAYDVGTDFDIALSTWDGQAWTPIEFLTASTANEIDPQLYVDEQGNMHVVYWVEETEEVYLTSRAATGRQWSLPELIVAGGSNPSIVFDDELRLIAFERQVDRERQVIVQTMFPGGWTTLDWIAATNYTETLNVQLHNQGGRVWIDWIHNENYLGYTHYLDGVWGINAESVPWLDRSWIGIEVPVRTAQSELTGSE